MTKQAGKILRVGIIQGGRIIEERLLRKREPVTIGWSPKNSFVVPAASTLPRSYVLFDLRGDRYVLNFREGSKGRVSVNGGALDLAELVRQGKARKRSGGYQFELEEGARGKVVVGEVTLLFQFVTPPPLPPRLKLPASARGGLFKGIDWQFLGIVALSGLLQIGPVTWLVFQDWPEPKRTEAVPDRFVSLMVAQPKERPEAPVPEKTDEGEGDLEKKEDEREEKREREAAASSRKSAADPEAAARAAAERKRALAKAVRGKTLLRFITAKAGDGEEGASGLVDSLAQGAARTKVDEAFAGAMGVTTASAGMERSRRGGAAQDAGGTVATIENLGASGAQRTVGSSAPREERRVRANIQVTGPSRTFGTGRMAPDEIAKVVRRRIQAVKSCYERELKKDPSLKGKVVVQFTIGELGRVTSSEIASTTMSSPAVGRCIEARIAGWRFPKPAGGSVTVSYPFVFTSSQ